MQSIYSMFNEREGHGVRTGERERERERERESMCAPCNGAKYLHYTP